MVSGAEDCEPACYGGFASSFKASRTSLGPRQHPWEVGQVADFFKVPHLLPGQLYHGLAWDPDAWLRKADRSMLL